MLDIDTVLGWRGKTVLDRDGEKVGTLGAIYLDNDDRPAYAGVRTGLFRRNESIVPLHGAQEVGGDVQVPYALDGIQSAPNVDPDVALSDDEQDRLHEHYGAVQSSEPAAEVQSPEPAAEVQSPEPAAEVQSPEPAAEVQSPEPAAEVQSPEPAAEVQNSEPAAEVTRSEEQVEFRAGEPKPRERVRLKKYTVTEQVEKTVPVRREEVRVEHDPPPEGGRIVSVEDVED